MIMAVFVETLAMVVVIALVIVAVVMISAKHPHYKGTSNANSLSPMRSNRGNNGRSAHGGKNINMGMRMNNICTKILSIIPTMIRCTMFLFVRCSRQWSTANARHSCGPSALSQAFPNSRDPRRLARDGRACGGGCLWRTRQLGRERGQASYFSLVARK